jgi:hypothetical protein
MILLCIASLTNSAVFFAENLKSRFLLWVSTVVVLIPSFLATSIFIISSPINSNTCFSQLNCGLLTCRGIKDQSSNRCPLFIHLTIFSLSAKGIRPLVGMGEGSPSTALTLILCQLPSIVQLLVKSIPACGLFPLWQLLQCLLSRLFTSANCGPDATTGTVNIVSFIHPVADRIRRL